MSLVLPQQRVKPSELDPEDRVFTHKSRPEWGMGVWVREESTRRRLRFEDGRLRAFKKGHYDMLVPVDSEEVDIDEVFERVMGEHEEASALSTDKVDDPVMSFDKQVEVFLHQFPGGFEGEAYKSAWGSDATASRNLHATAERVRELLTEGLDAGEAGQHVVQILDDTALVGAATVRKLKKLTDDRREALGAAALDLVHGDARFSRRFSTWLTVLNDLQLDPKWRVATTLQGLYHPDKHIVVRRQVLRLQARVTAPAKLPSKPSLAGYRRARRTARGTREKLVQHDLEPASMLDVYAFVWETLRPKGQKIAKEEL